LPGKQPWFDFWTGKRVNGGQTIDAAAPIDRIPVYVRAGSIVPMGPVKPYADAPSSEPIEIRVFPGADGSFALYDDAGDGFGYKSGDYSLVRMSWSNRGHVLSIAARDGHYASDGKFRIVCASRPDVTRDISYSGTAARMSLPGCV
jgi:alpha-D-xyloside xylohydrolase